MVAVVKDTIFISILIVLVVSFDISACPHIIRQGIAGHKHVGVNLNAPFRSPSVVVGKGVSSHRRVCGWLQIRKERVNTSICIVRFSSDLTFRFVQNRVSLSRASASSCWSMLQTRDGVYAHAATCAVSRSAASQCDVSHSVLSVWLPVSP